MIKVVRDMQLQSSIEWVIGSKIISNLMDI